MGAVFSGKLSRKNLCFVQFSFLRPMKTKHYNHKRFSSKPRQVFEGMKKEVGEGNKKIPE
jgi:hypothetical protein